MSASRLVSSTAITKMTAQQIDSRCILGAKVYLPGVGWRGYDPSQGLAVTDRHVAIAAAGDPLLSAPVSGTFRGNAITSELHAEIDITVASADAA